MPENFAELKKCCTFAHAKRQRPDGGIGRRAGLKHQCRKASRFEPGSGYSKRLLIIWFSAVFILLPSKFRAKSNANPSFVAYFPFFIGFHFLPPTNMKCPFFISCEVCVFFICLAKKLANLLFFVSCRSRLLFFIVCKCAICGLPGSPFFIVVTIVTFNRDAIALHLHYIWNAIAYIRRRAFPNSVCFI